MDLSKIRGWRVIRLTGFGIITLLFLLFGLDFLICILSSTASTKEHLLKELIKAKGIYCLLISPHKNDSAIQNLTILPADCGAKSNLDYIRILVNRGVLKENEIQLLCKNSQKAQKLSDLRSEDLAVQFTNASATDSGETVFFVIRVKNEDPWWQFWINSKQTRNVEVGYVRCNLDGSGCYIQKPIEKLNALDPLPSRDPKFLNP